MRSQTKQFTINLLRKLLQENVFVNNHTQADKDLVIQRWENGIPQKLIYAIESEKGEVEILENNVVETLIHLMDNAKTIRESRLIGQAHHAICILAPTTKEEEELFKSIIK